MRLVGTARTQTRARHSRSEYTVGDKPGQSPSSALTSTAMTQTDYPFSIVIIEACFELSSFDMNRAVLKHASGYLRG